MRYLLYLFIFFLVAACNNNADKQATTNDSTHVNDTMRPIEHAATNAMTNSSPDSTKEYVPSFNNQSLTDKISEVLMKLPFVKKSNTYLDSLTNHEHGIAFIFDSSAKGVSVMAGYNGDLRFETYYNFLVDPATFNVKILEPISGEMISTKEYIRSQKK
ncbi:MAG: hypothetical protein ABI480_19070 [Chitinophagaceae bacterium]